MSTSIPRTNILGAQISALTLGQVVEIIKGWIDRGEKHYVCICNVNSVMEAVEDPEYMQVLNDAGLSTSDGMPLVWLLRRRGCPDVERVAGPDLMLEVIEQSIPHSYRHFFYGGNPGVAQELASRLSSLYPGLHIAGTHTPPRMNNGDLESVETIDAINATRPDIIWLGLGGQKQDLWMANHRDRLDAPVMLGVGAAFDFYSGQVKRAPKWMQEKGLEWLYRLSQDPRRLWKRYVITNTRFVIELIKQEMTLR